MESKPQEKKVTITPPNFAFAKVRVIGTAPYLQNRFSSENRERMRERQKEGSQVGKKRRAKPPKDFEKVYRASMHVSTAGWYGIPASAFRNAMIDVCRMVEFDMTRAKMCVFIEADGLDKESMEPLVRIYGEPQPHEDTVKIGINQTDIAIRAMFKVWHADVTLKWDADVFTAEDIVNLLARAGVHIGVGAGRPFSKTSGGTGKGTWRVEAGDYTAQAEAVAARTAPRNGGKRDNSR